MAPLGCASVGQSQLWISGERARVIVIEFQPSGFSRCSYFSVAPMWLFYERDCWSFDYASAEVVKFMRDDLPAQLSLHDTYVSPERDLAPHR